LVDQSSAGRVFSLLNLPSDQNAADIHFTDALIKTQHGAVRGSVSNGVFVFKGIRMPPPLSEALASAYRSRPCLGGCARASPLGRKKAVCCQAQAAG